MTKAAAAAPAVEPLIGALLRMAHEIAEGSVLEAAHAAGYSEPRPAHFRLLRFPGVDGARPTELAERLGASKQAINPLLNDLEGWGYVERRPQPGDDRGRVVRLTARGRALMAVVHDAHAGLEAEWAERVGARRFATMRSALQLLVDASPPTTAPQVGSGAPLPRRANRR